MSHRRNPEACRTAGKIITPQPPGRGTSSDMPGKSNNAPLVARVAVAAALVLLLSTATTVAATTSTSTSASECSAESATCDEDPACLTCASSVADENTVSSDECSARYPEVFVVGAEGSTAGLCESMGAAYCCAFEDSDTAYDCMNGDGGAAAEGYWGCLLAEFDCSIEDMPCYGAPATDAPTGAPSPAVIEIMPPVAADDVSAGPTRAPLAEDASTPGAGVNTPAPADIAMDLTAFPSGTTPAEDADASSNGAVARTSSPSSVVVELAGTLGLLVVAAGMLL